MELSKEELRKIRANLPAGANKKLADQFNLQVGSIRNILSGSARNLAVVEAAVALAAETKAEETTKVTAIKKTVKAL